MRGKKKNIVPKLRLPGFEARWKSIPIMEVADIYDGTHQTPNYVKKGVKFVSVENIGNIKGTSKFITKEAFEKNYKIKPQKGDILMTRITAGIIGATAIVENDNPLGYYVSLALIRKKGDVSVEFLNQRIGCQFFKHELHKRIIHVAFPKKINLGDIGKCRLSLPPLPEQKKIAIFLTAVDTKLQLLTRKKELLEEYKKGVMQQLFSRAVRFKGEDGKNFPEWEEKGLGEVAKIQRGRFSPRPRNNPIYYNGKIPFVQTSDVVNSKGYISLFSQTLNEKGLKVSKLFPKGTILITIAANIGYCGILEQDMACPDSLIGITCHSNLLNRFLNYFLSTQQKKMENLAPEGAQRNINVEFLKPYPIILPTIIEQQKIADFLTALDKKIDQVGRQVEEMGTWKKGLLQQMFV